MRIKLREEHDRIREVRLNVMNNLEACTDAVSQTYNGLELLERFYQDNPHYQAVCDALRSAYFALILNGRPLLDVLEAPVN